MAVSRRPPPSSGGGRLISTANSHQRAVLDFVRRGSGHGIVEATAGSGKTTTLVMVAQLLVDELLFQDSRACFLAFNRSTAAELRARLPTRVESQTIHSLGRQILAASRSDNPELEQGKYARIALELLAVHGGSFPGSDKAPPADAPELAAHLDTLFDFARLELTDLADLSALASLLRRYQLPAPRPAVELAALYALLPVMQETGSSARTVDFSDMLYLPWRLSLPTPRFAFLCVDEAQDLSPLALGLVLRLIEAGARALFVGDPYQAIYEFAGADARSLRRIEELTAATRLKLSVSFRCPTRHVVLARRFSPDMKPASGAPAGVVSLLSKSALVDVAAAGDLIMARTNAPLPTLALDLAAAARPVRILGHDLVSPAKELAAALFARRTSLVGPLGTAAAAGVVTRNGPASNPSASVTALERDCEAQLERSAEEERVRLENELLISDRLPEELERSRLTHATLRLGLRTLTAEGGRRTLGALVATLERLFDPQLGHVLLATVHKAKGREAERTFLLYPELLGVSEPLTEASASETAAETDDYAAAEANVLFVALTRAKHDLYLVEAEPGAIAERLAAARLDLATRAAAATEANATPGKRTIDLGRRWDDVLRLALIMSEATQRRGISSRHGQARRVQERRWQAGSSRRRANRRRALRRNKEGRDNR